MRVQEFFIPPFIVKGKNWLTETRLNRTQVKRKKYVERMQLDNTLYFSGARNRTYDGFL